MPANTRTKKVSTGRLTKRQEKFVDAIVNPEIKGLQEAALKAGYAESHAHVQANENLKKPKILSAIEKRKQKIQEYCGITEEFVWGGVVKLALDSEQDNVKLGAYKTLGGFLGMDTEAKKNPQNLEAAIQNAIARMKAAGCTDEDIETAIHHTWPDAPVKELGGIG